jgi:hypothetical protein
LTQDSPSPGSVRTPRFGLCIGPWGKSGRVRRPTRVVAKGKWKEKGRKGKERKREDREHIEEFDSDSE